MSKRKYNRDKVASLTKETQLKDGRVLFYKPSTDQYIVRTKKGVETPVSYSYYEKALKLVG